MGHGFCGCCRCRFDVIVTTRVFVVLLLLLLLLLLLDEFVATRSASAREIQRICLLFWLQIAVQFSLFVLLDGDRVGISAIGPVVITISRLL